PSVVASAASFLSKPFPPSAPAPIPGTIVGPVPMSSTSKIPPCPKQWLDDMQYISPLTLIGTTFALPLDIKTIRRERKKWLTELELNATGLLDFEHYILDKNDLIEFFEKLENPVIAENYAIVVKDKTLDKFLESSELPK